MLEAYCHQEVIELHQFFQDWFNGRLKPSDAIFERVTAVLDEQFHLISPDGSLADKAPLLERIYQAHGSNPAWRLWTENFQLRYSEGSLALATYEEWQESDQGQTRRLSTVLFRHQPGLPNTVSWLHVHETWLPG